MKRVVMMIALLGMCTLLAADTLAPVAGTLAPDGFVSDSTTYVNALSVNFNMASAGNALVFSTFSCKTQGNASTGSWQLAQSGNYSQEIRRYLSGQNDAGIASTVHVFTGLSSGSNTITLQQKGSAGKDLTTYDANMVVVPLVTSGGSSLNYGVGQLSSATSTSNTSYVDANLSARVTVDRNDGGIFFASSSNSFSGGTATTGTWKMQYKEIGSETWLDVGNVTERYMSGSNDTGAVTLYAMAEDVDAGTYDVKLVFKSNDGNEVDTNNGTLAAVALSYDDVNGSGFFPTFAVTSSGGTHTDTGFITIPGATDNIEVGNSGSIVAAMSNTARPASTGSGTGNFDLQLALDGSPVTDTQENERYLASITDLGSAGAAGLFTGLSEDVYTVNGRYNDLDNNLVASNVSLVGFSTASIPEPMTLCLLGAGGMVMVLARKRKSL